jgi:GNAT superfamily N-acetyltransferase
VGVAHRARTPADLPRLLEVLQRTHEQEGYPVRAAAVSADWLADPVELGGWVAESDLRAVGHVALHPAKGPCVPLWQAAAGEQELAVVSRLFTDRTVRGAGTLLLEHAVTQASGLQRTAVLEVDVLSPALGFYLRRGWRDAGRAVQQWGHRTVDVAALLQPHTAQTGR